jgi:succinyl-CoA synthetase beta subunit
VGGGASEEAVSAAFTLLLADPDVQAVLVNIFGGIVRCDRVARGIISAARTTGMDRPLIVRLIGTNAEEGNRLLAESGLKLETATDMAEAAQKAIAAVSGEKS